MNKLVIVGARAMGREAYVYACECGMDVKGFLDSNPAVLDGFEGYPPVLGSVEGYVPCDEDVFVVALGEPEYKIKYAQIIADKGGRFATVVHPTAYVGKNVKIGEGCIICPNTTITNDTEIGNHVIINIGVSVNHDNRIGDGATICPGVHLAGRVRIGKNVLVGIGAIIIPDVRLGDNVFVAAGATVTKSFEKGRLMGVPAVVR